MILSSSVVSLPTSVSVEVALPAVSTPTSGSGSPASKRTSVSISTISGASVTSKS